MQGVYVDSFRKKLVGGCSISSGDEKVTFWQGQHIRSVAIYLVPGTAHRKVAPLRVLTERDRPNLDSHAPLFITPSRSAGIHRSNMYR